MNKTLILSKHRLNAGTSNSSDFSVDFHDGLDEGKYIVRWVSMSNSVYNVTANNNVVYTSLGNATLDPGYYTSSSLVTELTSKLQAVDANFSVSLDTDTYKLTISNTGAFTLDFSTNTSNSARRLPGFNQADTSSATSQTSDNVISLSSPLIYININESNHPVDTANSDTNGLANIVLPFQVGFGDFEKFLFRDDPQFIYLDNNTSQLKIKLYDDEGNGISLNGSEWGMLIEMV